LVKETRTVKKPFLLATAVVAACGLVYLGGNFWANAQGTTAGAPTSKIAIVNINKVLSGFNKAKALGQTLASQTQTYGTQMNDIRTKMAEAQKNAQNPALDAPKRDEFAVYIKALERQLEDLDAKARKEVGNEQQKILVAVYTDIQATVQRIATANGYELVLFYPDAPSDADASNPAVIMNKLRPAAAMPVYHRGLDITDNLVATLNQQFPAQVSAAPAPGAPAPATGVVPAAAPAPK
jgi:Skp family chaperone for outer membrane proteins